MAIYTVHEPPPRRQQTQPDPERFAFVRDGFSFWAFLIPPFWMLRHRLWLVLLCYLVLVGALEFGLNAIGASATVMSVVVTLVSLFIGLEAASLRRFTLTRRGWRNLGTVIGDDLDAAERRFYGAWTENDWASNASFHRLSSSSTAGTPLFQPPPGSSGVIGLFPEPGAQR